MRKKLRPHHLLVVLLGGMLLALLRVSLRRVFNQDELEAIHSGWRVLQGERPYVDFFQHHHAYLYYVLARVIDLVGETTNAVIAARLVHYTLLCGMLGVTWALAVELFDRRTAPAAVLILATTVVFVEKAIEVRPDVPQTLLGLAGFLLFVRHGRTRSTTTLVLAAVALGLSFLFLQKSLFLIGLVALAGAARVVAGYMTLRELAIAAAALLLTLLPDYAWLASQGALATYWDLNWRFNLPQSDAFSPVFGLVESYRESTVLWLFALVGAVTCLRGWRQRELALVAAGLLVSLFLVKRPWPQYYMVLLPLLSVVAAHSVYTLLAPREALATAVLLLGTVPGVYELAVDKMYTNERQLRGIEYVLSVTEPGDAVHDGASTVNLFRPDLDYFWFGVSDDRLLERYRELIGDYDYDATALVRELRPKVITTVAVDIDDPVVAELYAPSPGFKNLYLRRAD